MLQAHSLVWHYLWLAPHILSLLLVGALVPGDFRRRYPVFFSYLIFASIDGLSLYALDVAPSVSAIAWWQAFWVGTIIEGLLKFAVIGEVVHHLLHSWSSIAKLGRNLITGAGVVLVMLSAVAAAFAAPDNAPWVISGAHVLSQTIYLASAGLVLSIFVLAACFHIPWDRTTFGIALAAGIVWCEHLAISALIAGGVVRNRDWVDLANMGTYHITVVVWGYFLLVPRKKMAPAASLALPETNLDVWNRELERLLQ
jgi:hypothetical protein